MWAFASWLTEQDFIAGRWQFNSLRHVLIDSRFRNSASEYFWIKSVVPQNSCPDEKEYGWCYYIEHGSDHIIAYYVPHLKEILFGTLKVGPQFSLAYDRLSSACLSGHILSLIPSSTWRGKQSTLHKNIEQWNRLQATVVTAWRKSKPTLWRCNGSD